MRVNLTPRDLTESRVVFDRQPHERAVDKHVMVNGQWTKRPFILTRGPDGLSDRPAGEQEGPMKLLPCPHCGETEHLYPAYHGLGGGKPYAIDCLGCGADFVPREGIDVVKAWNRRAPVVAPAGEQEKPR